MFDFGTHCVILSLFCNNKFIYQVMLGLTIIELTFVLSEYTEQRKRSPEDIYWQLESQHRIIICT